MTDKEQADLIRIQAELDLKFDQARHDEMIELLHVQKILDEQHALRMAERRDADVSYAEMRRGIFELRVNHHKRPQTEAEIKAEAEALRIKRRS